MLETLRIQNYALIDSVEVDFRPGMNALTGETGAGKSIVVGALNLVLGARASSDAVRAGADRAAVEALFRVGKPTRRLRALLDEHGLELEDGALLLARVAGADGRSKAYAAGKLVPLAVLAALGDELVDLHGQHDHQSLLHPERQLELLDAFAGAAAAAAAVRAQVAELRAAEQSIRTMESDDRDRTRQIEFLRFEVGEIDDAALSPGEDEELRARLSRIQNAERIFALANQAYALLYESEDGNAVGVLGRAGDALTELAAIDEQFAGLSAQALELGAALDSLAAEVRAYTEAVEFDPEELETLNRRANLLRDLKRKYGATLDEVLAYRARAAEELAGYEQRDERLDAARQRAAALRDEAGRAAAALSEKRKAAARKLDKQVTATLKELGMAGARFETGFERIELAGSGIDRAGFLLAANAGEGLKPLKLVASGGEVSRIMLALKTVFAAADTIPTLIFDEIDAGVGGAVARKVADHLRALGRTHQVICITHIPQIAAAAAAHFNVAKQTQRGRTATQLNPVAGEDRAREVARLLDGTVSDMSLDHARALLAQTDE